MYKEMYYKSYMVLFSVYPLARNTRM